MNAGNKAKAYRKWLFDLEVVKVKEQNGVKFELRKSPEQELILVRYEDGLYDDSMKQSEYAKDQFEALLKELGFLSIEESYHKGL